MKRPLITILQIFPKPWTRPASFMETRNRLKKWKPAQSAVTQYTKLRRPRRWPDVPSSIPAKQVRQTFWVLVHDVATGRVNLEHLDKQQLPAELKGLDAGQLKARIAAQMERRKALQLRIDNLAQLRQAYIEKKVRQQKDKGAGSLDVQIYKCIQTQAAAKQIQYTDGPAY